MLRQMQTRSIGNARKVAIKPTITEEELSAASSKTKKFRNIGNRSPLRTTWRTSTETFKTTRKTTTTESGHTVGTEIGTKIGASFEGFLALFEA
jgi:hypothetical protein